MSNKLSTSLVDVSHAKAALQMNHAAFASGLAATTALHSQEEEEWQEVIAQQDSWQQQPAAAPATTAEQQAGVPSEGAAAGHAEPSDAGAGPVEAPASDGKAGALVGVEDTGPLPGSEAPNLNGLVCTCT